jgi:hypothetical protein
MPRKKCICTFGDECNGLGTLHCDPPCGGDQCVCTCGGERECDGCIYCEGVATDRDGNPGDAWDEP